MRYRICPLCGAALDSCEICDCLKTKEAAGGSGTSVSGKEDLDGFIISQKGRFVNELV